MVNEPLKDGSATPLTVIGVPTVKLCWLLVCSVLTPATRAAPDSARLMLT